MTDDHDPVLHAWVTSEAFKLRCADVKHRIIRDVEAGKPAPPMQQIADKLEVPLDVVEGGFRHSLEKYLLRNAPIVGKAN